MSVIETLALSVVVVLGVKVTLMVQLLPAANVLVLGGQVLVCAKSPALVPASPMLLMVRAALPLLVSVTVWAGLVVPLGWLPKARLVGLRVTPGDVLVVVLRNLLRMFAVICWLLLLA